MFIPLVRLAYRTYLLVGNGMTYTAVMRILLERSERGGEGLHIFLRLAQEVQHHTQGSLAAYARQRCKLIDCVAE